MTTFRTPFIAGNWKMHLGPAEAREFFASFLDALPRTLDRTVAFFPPAVTLAAARESATPRPDVLFGVQNLYWEERGAFTGETSAALAREAGAVLALIGHSERRHVFGETSEETGRKTRAALAEGLTPVLCVGELLDERERGEAEQVVESQLSEVFEGMPADSARRLIIAYEPVWAIGTGRTAAPGDAEQMHRAIRAMLDRRYGSEVAGVIPILYGGSVKPDNAADLLAAPEVDGLLVGGASMDPASFARICQAPA